MPDMWRRHDKPGCEEEVYHVGSQCGILGPLISETTPRSCTVDSQDPELYLGLLWISLDQPPPITCNKGRQAMQNLSHDTFIVAAQDSHRDE